MRLRMNDHDSSSSPTESSGLLKWAAERIWSLVVVCLAIGTVTTLAAFFARQHWVADIVANLRVQQVIGLLGVSMVSVCYRKWRWALFGATLITIHLSFFRSMLPANVELAGGNEIVVMVTNVNTANRNHEAIIDDISERSPDVFAVLELSTSLGDRIVSEFGQRYPFRQPFPMDDSNFGIGLYSRFPITDCQSFELNVDRILTIAATIEKESKQYRVIATHPLPPMGKRGFDRRNDHLKQLADRISRERNRDTMPTILVGDLNLTPWSPLFGDFERRSHLRRASSGMQPTWYARFANPAFGLVLDHGMISTDLQCVQHNVGPDIGSDHRSVTLRLVGHAVHDNKRSP